MTVAAFSGHAEVVTELSTPAPTSTARTTSATTRSCATGVTGDVEVLRAVLRRKPDLTLRNKYGGIAIIPACERGHVALVRELLARTDIDVDHVNDLGWTALLEAVILGDGGPVHIEIVACSWTPAPTARSPTRTASRRWSTPARAATPRWWPCSKLRRAAAQLRTRTVVADGAGRAQAGASPWCQAGGRLLNCVA